AKQGELPDEAPSFAAVIAGERSAWLAKPETVDVYDAKGIALEIIERAIGKDASLSHQGAERRAKHLHPRAAADIFVGDRVVGALGLVHPDVVDALDLQGPALVIEIDVRALAEIGAVTPKYRPIPVLPA